MSIYNENRDNNMSLHDEIREQNAKMKGQPLSVKLSYFKDYYLKVTIAAMICIFAIGALIVSIVSGPEDTIFGCYFINHTGSMADDTLLQDFIVAADIDTKKYDTFLDTSIYYNPDNQDPYEYIAKEKVMALISAKDLDVIVGDEDAMQYYAYGGSFMDITTVLPEDLLAQFQDKLYYYTTEDGQNIPIGIFVDDSPKLISYAYYDHSPAIFGIIANSDRTDYAIQFLRFLYQ